MEKVRIEKNKTYSIEDICLVAENKAEVVIGKDVLQNAESNFEATKKITTRKVYGLTTGVADLSGENPTSSDTFQKNILLSHAVGVGENLSKEIVRAAIFSRLLVLSQAVSGVSPKLLLFLSELLNNDIIPLVPSYGSIGLSDLTILAGIFVCICNKGKVLYKNEVLSPFDAFKKAGIEYPKSLQTREGLALINGNNAAIGLSCLLVKNMESVLEKALQISALSLEGRGGTFAVYNKINQQLKPFADQEKAADILEKLLENSEQIVVGYTNKKNKFLQDPPSFKTIAQVFGNAFDILEKAKNTITLELNSPSDNPLIITKNGKTDLVSSGNYLCLQLAMAADQLSLMLSSIAATSIARQKILLNDEYSESLPTYLITDSTNNSGFMICAYTAQSLLSEIKALLYPRSTFDISVANGWEDISSNALSAFCNTQKVLTLTKRVIVLELALAIQAMALRQQSNVSIRFGIGTTKVFEKIKKLFTLPIESDQNIREFLQTIQESENMICN